MAMLQVRISCSGCALYLWMSTYLLTIQLTQGRLATVARPPMGWRSWNSLFLDISQEKILAQARALAAKPPGGGKSLKQLGYTSIGVDDGWQACGEGVNGSFHDASGVPLVNKTRFQDVSQMVADIHKMGLQAGWYFNNCWCAQPEIKAWLPAGGNPAGDVAFLVKHGFDAVKVDGCGPAHKIEAWSKLIHQAHVDIELENCADNGPFTDTNYSGEVPGWLPASPDDVLGGGFSTYRISLDIAPQFYSAMHNLQKMVPFLKASNPLSRPGIWAYPDMLQVANKAPNGLKGSMSFVEWRTHFASWCVTSSPLILGFDLTNEELYNAAYPVVANERAIEVNQEWYGHPGRLVKSSDEKFWALAGKHANDECENGNTAKCSNTTLPVWQLWAKPLPDPGACSTVSERQAVLLINLSEKVQQLSFTLREVGLQSGQAEAIDIWSGARFEVDGVVSRQVDPHDSLFLLISPFCSFMM